ncbi:MAG TPA: hypothetical protein VGS11_09320 [Candidatus Bathyarchaeia archaeon]|nr:hypothetical protein [Candidatus Bathyarchaeia archaeon]
MPARLNSPRAKFMAAVTEETFQVMLGEAKSRGISVQELLRAVIIPEWVRGVRVANLITASPIAEPRAYIQRREGRTPF